MQNDKYQSKYKRKLLCSVCRYHKHLLPSFMTYDAFVTRVTLWVPHIEHELATLQEHHRGIRVARSLFFYVVFWRSLYVLLTFGRCIVYTSVIFYFWLLCWHFQTFLFTLTKLRNTYRIAILVLLINKFNFQNEYKLAPLIILILKDNWPFPLSYTKMEKHSIHMAYNRKTYILCFLYTCKTMYVQACQWHALLLFRGHRGRDRMVDGFTTTYAISAYHHWCCEFESLAGEVHNIMR